MEVDKGYTNFRKRKATIGKKGIHMHRILEEVHTLHIKILEI